MNDQIADTLQREVGNHKLMNRVAKQAPLTYRMFFGRRYVLPNYRQGDYISQSWQNWIDFDRVATFAAAAGPMADEPWKICMGNTVAALNYNRPTLFLEKELGEALMRTNILENLQTGDIKWRWKAFRVYLPAGLITINRQGEEDEPRWATHFDVSEIGQEGYSCPLPIARELDRFVSEEVTHSQNLRMLQQHHFQYKEHGLCTSTALNRSDHPEIAQTIYAQMKPWGLIPITRYIDIGQDLKGGWEQDEADRRFLKKLEHLVINVMLFLSSQPDDIEPVHVLRTANFNPKKMQGELVEARFVGQSQARLVGTSAQPHTIQPTGRQIAAHWVSGHWRRVVHGPGRIGRRLTWIQPYQTTDEKIEQRTSSSSSA